MRLSHLNALKEANTLLELFDAKMCTSSNVISGYELTQ